MVTITIIGLWSKSSRIERPQTCLFELMILQELMIGHYNSVCLFIDYHTCNGLSLPYIYICVCFIGSLGM